MTRKEEYPWDFWGNGDWHLLIAGVQFDAKKWASFPAIAYKAAKRRGYISEIHRMPETCDYLLRFRLRSDRKLTGTQALEAFQAQIATEKGTDE